MLRQLSLPFGSMALAATLSLTAAAQECPNGVCPSGPGPACSGDGANVYGPEYSNGGACKKGRGPAIVTPVEAYGVHPPGPDPVDLNRCWFLHRWSEMWIPYYAPLSPTSTSVRWKPCCYFPLVPYYTPYYCGYCPHRCHTPEPPPYGFDGGWGPGPVPGHEPVHPPLNYGGYSSVIQDDTTFWNMGGNGLVPYGHPPAPRIVAPDLVDMIRVSRLQGGGPCSPAPYGAPLAGWSGGSAPAILPPTAKPNEKGGSRDDKGGEGTPSTEKAAPPQ
jgi:hypothetical protein